MGRGVLVPYLALFFTPSGKKTRYRVQAILGVPWYPKDLRLRLLIVCHNTNVSHLAGIYTENETVVIVIAQLKLLNSEINPVVYAFLKREIKKELKRLFCWGRKN